MRQRIFKPFFTTKDVEQGSGLGLAICRQIIEGHHGSRLALDDTVERGACFVVRLPLARAQASSRRLPSSRRSDRRPSALGEAD